MELTQSFFKILDVRKNVLIYYAVLTLKLAITKDFSISQEQLEFYFA